MVNLEAISPFADELPLTIGNVSIAEIILPAGNVWSVSPSPVKAGTSIQKKNSKTLWIGRDHALQIGGAAPTSGVFTDQSDAWGCVTFVGADTNAVLARLCPVDLAKMQSGDVVRTLINHLVSIIVAMPEGYEIYVFRAFARTLIQEIKHAAKAVDGRNRLGL